MSISSSKQFRSYVISWFLMIVGLIVLIGGGYIYYKAEDYLFSSYQQEQLNKIDSMSAMIDAQQHAKFIRADSISEAFYQQLSQTFGNQAHYRLYTLNYLPDEGKLQYAVDPEIATQDTIQIYNAELEINLAIAPNKKVSLLKDHAFVEQLNLLVNQQSFHVRLEYLANKVVLLMNNKELLQIRDSTKLAATYNNLLLDEQHTYQQTSKSDKDEFWNFTYQYIKQKQPINPPGKPITAHPKLLQLLRANTNFQAYTIRLKDELVELPKMLFFSPLKFSANQPKGVLVLEIEPSVLLRMRAELLQSILLGFSFLGIFLMIASIFFARKITSPLEQLNTAIERLARNDFNFKLSPKGFGSAGFVADQFNLMLNHIQSSRNDLIQMNKAFSRFVPHQLLKQLSSSGVASISLGDCCEREMTVLFCDIRGFTTLSESMSPQANFLFINRYLSQIAPVINKRGGIIDKYLGDGIMALFPNSVDHAVQAAIEMLGALDEYNKQLVQKRLPIIEVGIGLHTGKMMLGTVGTPSRMDATVVSDTVNAAARVESMTKAFSTKILITEETKRQITDLSAFQIRYIASCLIQGKSKPVTLYEIFDNDSVSVQKEKRANQTGMIMAWKKYQQGDASTAIQMYQKMIERSPYDKSLFAMIECCQKGRL